MRNTVTEHCDKSKAPRDFAEATTTELWAELVKRRNDERRATADQGVKPPVMGSREDFQSRLLAMASETLGIIQNARDPAQTFLAEQVLSHLTTMASIWLNPIDDEEAPMLRLVHDGETAQIIDMTERLAAE